MTARLLAAAFLPLFFCRAATHSMMGWPQSTSPNVCRLGGNPNPGRCPGPCDLKAIYGGWANFDKPEKPAATFYRGQRVGIKYQRNNHGPGGFVRHTIVPLDSMMNKRVHARNAFFYSCFGAHAVRAMGMERKADQWGFSLVGNDGYGQRHKQAMGYYVTTITIPPVIPDGKYILGWVWYGGTGGPVSNWGYRNEPFWKGYFGDYWSCSFIEIKGGRPLQAQYTPVFKNDMKQFSKEGCMSANDIPGRCRYEPCIVYGKYQKPWPFKSDKGPEPLTPDHFRSNAVTGRSGGAGPIESPDFVLPKLPDEPAPREYYKKKDPLWRQKRNACRCIGEDNRCGEGTAWRSVHCKRWVKAEDQHWRCKRSCCQLCKLGVEELANLCINLKVKAVCYF